jgi:parvulin-like peptidyl-prolyl isomerase
VTASAERFPWVAGLRQSPGFEPFVRRHYGIETASAPPELVEFLRSRCRAEEYGGLLFFRPSRDRTEFFLPSGPAGSYAAAMTRTALLLGAILASAGCDGASAPPPTPPAPVPAAEPERITVQHILISFAGTRTKATRTRGEAEKLAGEVMERVKKGEDFDALMKQLSDDTGPGIYPMCNDGQTPYVPGETPRRRMVPAFGNVGFKLGVGEVGMAAHDPVASPFGWHIIKRLK